MKIKGFDDAFELLIGHEGGYSFNPVDPGGETMYGITIRVARRNNFFGNMQELTLAKAKEIARREYWDVVKGDALPPELAFQLFDTIYNGGRPVFWLQRALGLKEDGVFGPATLAAAQTCDVPRTLLRFNAYRLKYLAGLPVWPSFCRGWVNRVANNLLEGAD